ncbi:MAG: PrsW family intramembrane metalloprotease, partial [Crocinitomicaceae bacterium]|nr:PrsW family intramembrane metalloprotease [Crocinitomicaceae bacterium]
DTIIQDIGHLFTALHMANLLQDSKSIQGHLSSISDKSIPYFEYVQGLADYLRYDWYYVDSSETHLLNSIQKGEGVDYSYTALSYLYRATDDQTKLKALVYDENIVAYLPHYVKRITFFNEFDFSSYWGLLLEFEIDRWHFPGVLAALFLLILWVYFLRKMDIYEPEKWIHLVMTFILSIISMQLLYPMHDFLWEFVDYNRPSHPFEDLWYMVISIGGIEELVKIIPVLIMLKLTKAINEPFDYVLYASVSGLGFAFIENIGYFDNGLTNISIRGFYCCIVYMSFSATIGYGLMLAKYRGYNKVLMFFLFYFIASFLHGFYDFWLLDWWAINYYWVSDLVLILMIYLWILYAGNTLNNSNFYNPAIRFRAERMKFILLFISIAILMTGYVAVSLNFGSNFGKEFLITNALNLQFFILFLILSMGSMKIIRGYIEPLTFPFRSLFPRAIVRNDVSGHWIELKTSRKFDIVNELVPEISGLNQCVLLKNRIIIDDEINSYVAELSEPIEIEGHLNNRIVLSPQWEEKRLNSRQKILVNVFLVPNEDSLGDAFLKRVQFTYLGKMFSTYIPEEV